MNLENAILLFNSLSNDEKILYALIIKQLKHYYIHDSNYNKNSICKSYEGNIEEVDKDTKCVKENKDTQIIENINFSNDLDLKIEKMTIEFKNYINGLHIDMYKVISPLCLMATDISDIKANTIIKSSYDIGKKGENIIETILSNLYLNYKNISSQPHYGDFIIHFANNINCIIEVKNYNSKVPDKEIEKFIKDLDNNEVYKFGILVSLKSLATNNNQKEYNIYKTPHSKCYCILNNLMKDDDKTNITKFNILFNLMLSDILYDNNLINLYKFYPVIKKIHNSLSKYQKSLLKIVNEINLDISNIDSIIDIIEKNKL